MKLTYWIAECLDDSKAYSIRCKTKKEVLTELARRNGELTKNGSGELNWFCDHGRFGQVHKAEVEYTGAFDLLEQCLGEGGIYEGQP